MSKLTEFEFANHPVRVERGPDGGPAAQRRPSGGYIAPEAAKKLCSKCHQEKPLTEFNKDRNRPDGRRSYCKACKAESDTEYRRANRERIAQRDTKYYQRNRERIAEYYQRNRERIAEYYQRNRERIAEYYQRSCEAQPAGVYKITHKPTGAFYFGSSDMLETRWDIHRSQLSRKNHINPGLRKLAQNSTADDFEFVIIQKTPKGDKDWRRMVEAMMINAHEDCLNVRIPKAA